MPIGRAAASLHRFWPPERPYLRCAQQLEGIRQVFETMENVLGLDRMRQFHAHFSKIEYTEKGGEKCHLTFADTVYGPQFEPVAEMIVRKNASPTIICESAGTQAEDAATMKRMYAQALAACGQAE